MSHRHPHGEPKQIFIANEKVEVFIVPLTKMLLHPDVRNRKIVVFSLIGTYRQGKSFFLDYCLRFLYAKYPSINNPIIKSSNRNGWIGNKDDPLLGFSWRAGCDRDTTGINVWNDVFLHTDERTGENIAIIVMDTQGLFDNDTSTMNNSRIFAIGTLLSSIQIFNLPGLIHENMLQYLQFATEYAKYAMSDDNMRITKPFQSMMFLIRDWRDEKKYAYGIAGGQSYLNNYLEIKSTNNNDLKHVRESVNGSFEKLSCCLLPDPGPTVTTNSRNAIPYDGNWGGMTVEFKNELVKVIEHILSPMNIIIKKVNGDVINGKQYLNYAEKYFKELQSNQLPEPKTLFQSTVETQLNCIVNKCFDYYKELVYDITGETVSEQQASRIHENFKELALVKYDNKRKMGNAEDIEESRIILEYRIETYYQEWKDVNDKNIKMLCDEKEKTRMIIEENEKLLKEQIALVRETSEKLGKVQTEQNEKINRLMEENEKNLREIREQYQVNSKQDADAKKELLEQMAKQSAENIQKLIDKFEEERKILTEALENQKKRLEKKKAKKEAKKGAIEKTLGNIGSKVGAAGDAVCNGIVEITKTIKNLF